VSLASSGTRALSWGQWPLAKALLAAEAKGNSMVGEVDGCAKGYLVELHVLDFVHFWWGRLVRRHGGLLVLVGSGVV
jgi:hypothetical protein